ncbi:MAG: hypothetical protein V7636_2056 [Actinomycetota bacterium]
MSSRRGFLAVLCGCVVAGALVLIAAGRTWARGTFTTVTGSVDRVSVTGHAVEPALPALGIALLVLAAGVIAARRWLRRLVGLVVVCVGAAVVALAAASRSDAAAALKQRTFAVAHTTVPAHTSGWAVLSAVAGVVAVGCGALTVVIGSRWPALGARYDAAGARGATPHSTATSMSEWDALDRGEDPTI